MSNAEQTVPLDEMIRRLEEANARAHERVVNAKERASETPQDATRHPSDQQAPAVSNGRSLRVGLALGLIGLLLTAALGSFVWQSPYGTKLIGDRWVSWAWTTPQAVAPTSAPMSPELAQRLQMMAHDLANLAQGIKQLKNSEEQEARNNAAVADQLKAALSQTNRDNAAVGALRAALSQMTRDNAAVAEQLKIALAQITRDSAAVLEQLKAAQEQTVRLIGTRARRNPVPTISQTQAQPEAAIHSPPKQY